MTNEITYEEYKSTLILKMENVTENALPIIDIWSYVRELVDENIVLNYVFENQLVEYVYRNGNNTYDHVLLPTDNRNNFIVPIIDISHRSIKGHFNLDLELEYGLK